MTMSIFDVEMPNQTRVERHSQALPASSSHIRLLRLSLVPTPVKEPETQHTEGGTGDATHRVILYNDDWHGMDEVVAQVQKATGCDIYRAMSVTLEAHHRGRAICYRGERSDCHRVASILREIRLQVEVDCD